MKDGKPHPCGVDFQVRSLFGIIPPTPDYIEDPDHPIEDAVELPDEVVWFALSKQSHTKKTNGGKISIGKRNDTLTSRAGVWRRQGMNRETIAKKLHAENRRDCEEPLDDEEVETIAASVSRYEPAEMEQKQNETEAGFCPMSAEELLNKEIVPIRHVLEDYVPKGALVLFVGYMKTGKSTWAYRLTVSVAQGKEFMSKKVEQGPVLVLAVEEHERDVKRRLKKFGMIENDPIFIHVGKLKNTPEIVESIKKFVVEHKVVLVLIDSLSRFWSVVDDNNNMEVIREVEPLLDMAHETNTAIMPIHHERKSGGDDGRGIRGGSSLFWLGGPSYFFGTPAGRENQPSRAQGFGEI